jgi:hypothetical protein
VLWLLALRLGLLSHVVCSCPLFRHRSGTGDPSTTPPELPRPAPVQRPGPDRWIPHRAECSWPAGTSRPDPTPGRAPRKITRTRSAEHRAHGLAKQQEPRRATISAPGGEQRLGRRSPGAGGGCACGTARTLSAKCRRARPDQPAACRLAINPRAPTGSPGSSTRTCRTFPGRDLDLAQEPLGAERLCQIRAQHLDRHAAVVLEILGEIDGCRPHRALARCGSDRRGRR